MRFCLTMGFLMDSRPCFLMSVFLLLAYTTLETAGARLLHILNKDLQHIYLGGKAFNIDTLKSAVIAIALLCTHGTVPCSMLYTKTHTLLKTPTFGNYDAVQ